VPQTCAEARPLTRRDAPGAQSTDLYNKETLPTMLKGSSLMVHLMNGVMIDGAASNATVTSANIMADKVAPGMRLACSMRERQKQALPCTSGPASHAS